MNGRREEEKKGRRDIVNEVAYKYGIQILHEKSISTMFNITTKMRCQ